MQRQKGKLSIDFFKNKTLIYKRKQGREWGGRKVLEGRHTPLARTKI